MELEAKRVLSKTKRVYVEPSYRGLRERQARKVQQPRLEVGLNPSFGRPGGRGSQLEMRSVYGKTKVNCIFCAHDIIANFFGFPTHHWRVK